MSGIELLGTTLLHFLWEGTLIAGVYAVLRGCVSRPQARYFLACAALATMAAAPVATWVTLRSVQPRPGTPSASLNTSRETSIASSFRNDLPQLPVVEQERIPSAWLAWVAAAWMSGVTIFWLRLMGGWIISLQLRRRRVDTVSQNWQETFDRLRARLKVPRRVRLVVSGLVYAPTVAGFLRPVVLVPMSALIGLPAEQMEALLLHELAHIRRYDCLVNAIQSIVEALLFYHPAVWWVSGHMRSERELCCDDMAVGITGDAESYARALAKVAVTAQANYQAALAATGGSLANRVARLLEETGPAPRAHSRAGVAAAVVLAAIPALAVTAQNPQPQFEVASIKQVGSGAGQTANGIQSLSGELRAHATVRVLMQQANGVEPFQVEGGPDWARSDLYDIEAKPTGNPDRAQMFLMLQSLLADRFQLKFHRETREMPEFALVPTRDGLKLPPPQDGSCVETTDVASPLTNPGARMQPPSGSVQILVRCGNLGMALGTGGAVVEGGKVPMAKLAELLSRMFGRMVVDQTAFQEYLMST